jgi:hypothetical protein
MIRITETLSTEAGDFDATVEIERRHMLHGDGWYARLETAATTTRTPGSSTDSGCEPTASRSTTTATAAAARG